MKIAFFTENSFKGPVPRNHPNMRTDMSWIAALKAIHYPLNEIVPENFDFGIIIVPKKNPNQAFEFYNRNEPICKYWAVMQEADQIAWQRFSLADQINYLNFVNELDLIFVHNEIDERYFKGLFPHKKVSILPSLMIEDAIPEEAKKAPQKRSSCIIGGNWTDWYSGQDSFMISQEFGEKIYVPSMGRKQPQEEQIDELTHLPYMNWSQWMVRLNQFKYAVHLMRTYAAGTFPLNCARLKIPCIGWSGTDTQKFLFPNLSPDEGDMTEARRLAKLLKENKQFYIHCAEYAFKMYNENYSEENFIKRFKESIELI